MAHMEAAGLVTGLSDSRRLNLFDHGRRVRAPKPAVNPAAKITETTAIASSPAAAKNQEGGEAAAAHAAQPAVGVSAEPLAHMGALPP